MYLASESERSERSGIWYLDTREAAQKGGFSTLGFGR
jgi:hypothetical protein